jgi:endonuclease/exonuclease/phosphatase family metal-dependent hydrolase
MIILSWNCRGLGGPSAIPNLRKLAREHKPDILFLSETLSHARNIEPIRVMLGYDCCLAIDVDGRSGGLVVFWKDNSKCSVLNYTRNFINMLVEDEQRGEWRLTCYYGYPERSKRRHAWNLLRELVNMSSIPWCIIGDFNDLLSQEDKKGIHPHPNWLCMGFRQAIGDCNLTDIPLAGHPFTWIKSRGTPHVIEERLDRVMASTSWLHLYPNVRLSNLLASHADHSPILLQCSPTTRVRFNDSFRFENKWLKEPDLEETVIDGWGVNENIEMVDRIARCANKLQRWGRRKRVKFKEEINTCVREMEALRDNQGEAESRRYQELSDRHATLLVQEEEYWKQRAKMHWLQEGDLNTRFFHMSATARGKRKKVTHLVDEAGTEVHT